MLYYAKGSPEGSLSNAEARAGLFKALEAIGHRSKVLALPPDFTRFHSRAGELTRWIWEYYGKALTDILPATGTHVPMTQDEIGRMYGTTPGDLFRVHDWRNDVVTLGEVPSSYIREVSEGKLDYPWPAQVNRRLPEGGHDLILSIGQVVPHEVVGMANYNKNVFVGTGGKEGINKSHFLGAVYGMERMMGRADTPVRRVLNFASEKFANDLPIVYMLSVVGREAEGASPDGLAADGPLVLKGLFVGDDEECFLRASELSLEVNFTMVDEPLQKVVVYLDPDEFKSTWLGNKAIYRTRMAIADGGELLVIAPGVRHFGEDRKIDQLIRQYGYVGTPRVLAHTDENPELQENLSAAAHLIHGSSEDRFTITYCPGGLSREEIEGANYRYGDYREAAARYDVDSLRDGYQKMPDGERIFFISNPAVGLWAHRDRFGAD